MSYDEVTDDLDEIIALRGEGRYFGVTDPDDESGLSRQTLGPLCSNCHKRGHIRAKCKVVICHKCGAIDDHYESQCPTTIICARCGEKGHIVLSCKSKVKRDNIVVCVILSNIVMKIVQVYGEVILSNHPSPVTMSEMRYQEFTVIIVVPMSIMVMNVQNKENPEYLILEVLSVGTIYLKNFENCISYG